jgi:hypothetical protein
LTAQAEEKKADHYFRLLTEAELEKRALVEGLGKKPELSGEDKTRLASAIIRRAARDGLSEVQIYRFSKLLCTDGGIAIGSDAAGWQETLRGIPREIYELWSGHLQPLGYRIRYLMTGPPHSAAEDIRIVVIWGD